MTLSLAAVFIPLVFLPGLLGRIFREFSVTIIVAIFASGLVSLTLTPLMCARVLAERGPGQPKKTWVERHVGDFLTWVVRPLRAVVWSWFLRLQLDVRRWCTRRASWAWYIVLEGAALQPAADRRQRVRAGNCSSRQEGSSPGPDARLPGPGQ